MVSVIFRDECGSVCVWWILVLPIYNRRVVYWLLQSSLDLKVAVTPVGSVIADTASSSLGGLIEISEDQQRKWAVMTGVKHYENEMDRAKAWDDGIWGRPRKKAKMWVSVKIEKVVRVKKMGLEKLQRDHYNNTAVIGRMCYRKSRAKGNGSEIGWWCWKYRGAMTASVRQWRHWSIFKAVRHIITLCTDTAQTESFLL